MPPPPPTPPPPEAFVRVDDDDDDEELESYEEFPDSVDGDGVAVREARALDFRRDHAPPEQDATSARRDSTLSSGYLSRSEYTGYSEDVVGDEADLQQSRFGKVESLPDSLSDPFMGKEGVSVVGTEG